MNKLSNDDIMAVFRFLGTRARNRFASLSKRTELLKTIHLKEFPKPTIEIAIYQVEPSIEPDDGRTMIKNRDRMFMISTPKRRVVIEVSDSGKIMTSNNVDSRKLMESFYHHDDPKIRSWWTLKRKGETANFDVFTKWLFSKFDVSLLRFAEETDVARLVFNALKASTCKCFEISIIGPLEDTMPESRELDILVPFGRHQTELEVNTKLRLETASAVEKYAEKLLHRTVLSFFFGDPLTQFSKETLSKLIAGVVTGWKSGRYKTSECRVHFENCPNKPAELFRMFFDIIRYKHNSEVSNIGWLALFLYLDMDLPDKIEKFWDLKGNLGFTHELRFNFSFDGSDLVITALPKPKEENDPLL